MVKVQHFGAAGAVMPGGNFERNVARIGAGMRRFEAPPETAAEKREAVKESLRAIVPASELQHSETTPSSGSVPSYLEGEADPSVTGAVQALVEEALHGELEDALRKARRHSAVVEDRVHDALVDVVVPELERRGKL